MDANSESGHRPVLLALSAAQRKQVTLAISEPVSSGTVGERFKLDVEITNRCGESISSEYPQRIFLAYHWADSAGNYEQYAGMRTALPNSIANGETCVVTMTVNPPIRAGEFELQVGLLQEGISWFEKNDPQHLQKISVAIKAGKPAGGAALKVLQRFAEDRPVQVDTPPAIFSFELTNQCPFKCIMCARTESMTRAEGVMSFATFKKAVDEFVELNPLFARNQDIWLHGFGESLVHPEFGKFMRYAVDKGINAGLSINPLMLTKKVARELLDAGPRHLYVALDGHDDETFEKIRGVPNAYRKSRKRLLKFLEEKQARGLDTRITLSMIDFPNNRQSIEEMGQFWKECGGIDEFVAKPFVSWDGKAEEVNLLFDKKDQPKPLDKVVCDFPWSRMTVSWDGDLVPCCFDYNKRYALGNINEQSLAQIWNGEPMHALRREFITNKVTNPLCQGCQYLYQEVVPDA